LNQLYQEKLKNVSTEEVPQLLWRQGELLEKELGDEAAAIKCYETLLSHDADHQQVNKRLNKFYQTTKQFEKLVELYQDALDQTKEESSQIRLMLTIANLYHSQLDEAKKSADLLHEILRIQPTHKEALVAYED